MNSSTITRMESIMLPIHTILHPTDFSSRAQSALEFAAALARDYRAQLVVMHVLPPAFVVAPDGLAVMGPPENRDDALARLRSVCPADARVTTIHQLADGDPAAEIVKAAGDVKADLIVMGTHGWTGLSRLLMGSVAEGVMRKAPCPVLTVKVPATHEVSAPSAAQLVTA